MAMTTGGQSVRGETMMAREAAAAAALCGAQISRNAALMRQLGAVLRAKNPPFAATIARGSSDQAAAFAKMLFETRVATPTLSHAPSIGALYQASSPRLRGVPLFAISQSGRSPDLLRAAEDAQRQGAILIALVNDTDSPLAARADVVVPLHAGVETSVAATKSFIATLVALTHLCAAWAEDRALLAALEGIEPLLAAAARHDWRPALPILSPATRLLVLGRGFTLPIAGEAALKFKEVAGIHAEAFSLAEVAHGPMTLITAGDPVLIFAPGDAARAGLDARLADFGARGARTILVDSFSTPPPATLTLPALGAPDPALAAIAMIQSFYPLANALALARGRDPDHPPFLAKVTKTL